MMIESSGESRVSSPLLLLLNIPLKIRGRRRRRRREKRGEEEGGKRKGEKRKKKKRRGSREENICLQPFCVCSKLALYEIFAPMCK